MFALASSQPSSAQFQCIFSLSLFVCVLLMNGMFCSSEEFDVVLSPRLHKFHAALNRSNNRLWHNCSKLTLIHIEIVCKFINGFFVMTMQKKKAYEVWRWGCFDEGTKLKMNNVNWWFLGWNRFGTRLECGTMKDIKLSFKSKFVSNTWKHSIFQIGSVSILFSGFTVPP